MIYDISPEINQHLKVWPGDTAPCREVLLDLEKGSNITLSTLRSTVHLGAHADAPNHYSAGAPSIAERSLDYYLGRCQVLSVVVSRGAHIAPADLSAPISEKRVLLKTGTFLNPESWNTDFAAPSAELIDVLHERGVVTIGVDTPSIDLFDSKDLPAHKRLLAHDMANLEGLVLRDVPDGFYELIAPPLKLKGFDASPVRAVLRTL